MSEKLTGGFTLPGEAGYEELTLKLAKVWGADVIRDSDGTKLSKEILDAGYGIYSTICIIRDHNEWVKAHPEHLQQTFLMTAAKMAVTGEALNVFLLEDFFSQQFQVNASLASIRYWQVYDRTTEQLLTNQQWTYDETTGAVLIRNPKPWHNYTVSFLAYRLWEEISMYNHVTNGWDKEHLLPVDPRHGEAQEYLYAWLKAWCENNPDTTVVRFTSMFYNFVWIWGSNERNRNLFTDWGSYDFTVSPQALADFSAAYGYELTAEDFINQGKLHVTHMPPSKKQLDYMEFTNRFVVDFGRRLVELVHSYGKQAYVFYDDSWVGIEPYKDSFEEFGFDGLIKCIFSGFEVRLCAGAKAAVHEVRLHPYLFPVGLGGAPTFAEGGNPALDAKKYWTGARRAMLRCKIDRIGLGGYLHLTERYPDFVDTITEITAQFRQIKKLHEVDEVWDTGIRVGVLTAWGSLRSWTLSGHFHETFMHDLIHVNEALAGFPVQVEFVDFQQIKQGQLKELDVIINAGDAGTAWSGGDAWKDEQLAAVLNQWVYNGGTLIGIGQPSFTTGYINNFRLAPILGIDEDTGERGCHGRWHYAKDVNMKRVYDGLPVCSVSDQVREGQAYILPRENLYLTDGNARVLADTAKSNPIGDTVLTPTFTINDFGAGKGIYLSHFAQTPENNRLLLNLLLINKNEEELYYLTNNCYCECGYFPQQQELLLINNSGEIQPLHVKTECGIIKAELKPFEMKSISMQKENEA